MKILDAKSFAAGLVTGTLGITTVFAATGIQSAVLSGTAMTLNGTPLPLDRSLVSVTMEQEPEAVLYAPAEELLAKLKVIAVRNKRSANKEMEYALEQYVRSFEERHEEIIIEGDAL